MSDPDPPSSPEATPDAPRLEFPSEYLLKAIGTGPRDLEDIVLTALSRHGVDLEGVKASVRPSRGGKYLAVSAEFYAESRAQLDEIYRELGRHPRVKMML